MGHELDDEPLLEEEELSRLLDRPLRVRRVKLNKTKPLPEDLYTDRELQFHRAQAIIESLSSLHKGLGDIARWEKRMVDGEPVTVTVKDVMRLVGIKHPATVRQRFLANARATRSRSMLWLWKDIRERVIIRFSQVVMHNYLAALE
jgi:hypothetical protein